MKISFLNQQDKFPVTKKLRTLMETAAKTSLRYMQFRTDVEISVMPTDLKTHQLLSSRMPSSA